MDISSAANNHDSLSTAPLPPIVILAIGQHAVLLSALERFLQDTATVPMRVITAASGEESLLAPLFAQHPQVVLVDLGVPVAPWLALLARVRAYLPHAAILALGWLDSEEYRHAVQMAGADAFLCTDELCAQLPGAIIALAQARQIM